MENAKKRTNGPKNGIQTVEFKLTNNTKKTQTKQAIACNVKKK
jgi:hypothetical protein